MTHDDFEPLQKLFDRIEELEKKVKRLESDFRQYRIQNYDKMKKTDD